MIRMGRNITKNEVGNGIIFRAASINLRFAIRNMAIPIRFMGTICRQKNVNNFTASHVPSRGIANIINLMKCSGLIFIKLIENGVANVTFRTKAPKGCTRAINNINTSGVL